MIYDPNNIQRTGEKNNLGRMSPFFPVLLAVMLAVGVFLGYNVASTSNTSGGGEADKIQYIMSLIETDYVDEVDPKKLRDQAIEGMLAKLDPHSILLPPKDAKEARQELEGKFGGVGIQFMIHKDSLMVSHLIDGSPAQLAGIKEFDRIVEVDKISMTGKKLNERLVKSKLKGDVGSNVRVKILRKGEKKLIELSIVRGVIPVPSVHYMMLDKTTGYIQVDQFGQNTARDFTIASRKLKEEGMKKMVLDLRGNGGGYLSAAEMMADEFLKAGRKIVYTEGKKQPRRDYMATSDGILEDLKVAVLVDQNSASASEIVAGALQDNDRAMIVGRRTFGKGLVQEEIDVKDGYALRLTVARYYTPSGRCIQKPYGEGIDYEAEHYTRNELYAVDSSIFVDSLKYKTVHGRTVYACGGIMPDYFVPYDSSYNSYYLIALVSDSVRAISEYAFEYTESNMKTLLAFKDVKNFNRNFKLNDAIANEIMAYGEKKGIKPNPAQFAKSKPLIERLFKQEIASLLWNNNGYMWVRLSDDRDVKKALEVLNKK